MRDKCLSLTFPVSIREFLFHQELKEDLLSAIARQEDARPLITPTNVIHLCDWENSRNDFSREWLQILTEPLTDHLLVWAEELMYDAVDIKEIWFQQYLQEGTHDWHTHGCNFTNVYYLELPEGTAKTQYIDPITKKEEEFDVKEGDIITFPSWLLHRAPPNHSIDRKTIISWNMDAVKIAYD